MARTNKVEVEIVATDEASPKIDKLEAKIDGLEADEARVTIVANTERLQTQLDNARRKLDTLDGDEATVQARLVGSLEKDLEDAQALFRQLDGKTGTVKFRADTKGLDDAKRKMDGLVSAAGDLPGPLGDAAGLLSGAGGIAAGAGVAAGALFAAASSAASTALDAQTIADLTGASVENASRLLALTQQVGVEYGDVADLVGQVNQVLSQQPEIVEQLGINLDDGRDGIERIVQIVDVLNSDLFDVNDRVLLMGTLFGEQGARQVQKLVSLVGDDLQAAMDDVSSTQVITPEDVERAREFSALMADVNAAWQGLVLAVGNRVIPLLETAKDIVDEIGAGIEAIPGNLEDEIGSALFASWGDIINALKEPPDWWPGEGDEPGGIFDPQRLDDINAGLDATGEKVTAAGEGFADWFRKLVLVTPALMQIEEAQRRVTDASEAQRQKLIDVNMAAEAHDRVTDLDRERDAARALTTQYETLFGELNEEASKLNMAAAFERARARLAEGNLTLIEAGQLLSDLKLDLLQYAQQADVPIEVVTKAIAEVDTLALDQAEQTLNHATRDRDVRVTITPNVQQLLDIGASADALERAAQQSGAGSQSSSAVVPITNQTIILPPGTPAQTYGNFQIFVSRNGERTEL